VRLAFSAQPSTTPAGVAIAGVQVAAVDAFGQTATGYTGTVTLVIGSNPSGSALFGAASVPAVVGVADFPSVSLNHIGTGYTLVASAGGLTSATSAAFDILVSHPQLNAVFASPALSGEPYGVAISRSGAVLVARVLGGTVTRFDLPDTLPGFSVPAGMQPVHLAINSGGTRAYVINQAGQGIHVIDVASTTVLDSLPLTNAGFNIAVAPSDQRAYVTTSDGRVYVIATGSNTIVDSMRVGTAANGLAFSPDATKLYISSRDAGTVTVFNTANDAPLSTITTGGALQRLAVTPDGSKLFAADESNGVRIINLPAGTSGPIITLDGSGYGLGLSPDGNRLFATDPITGKVFIVNAVTGQLVTTLTVGGNPRNVAFDRDGLTAVVTDGAGRVIFIH
jgi:YVTN family beta-propeller protein